MSQPISRILYRAHSAAVNIHPGQPLPVGSSGYLQASASNLLRLIGPAIVAGRDALLPVGFTQPPPSLTVLVRSYRTLSPLPLPHAAPKRSGVRGGLLSVALSRGSPRVAVSNHRALWSPDFPRPAPSPALGAGSQGRVYPVGSFAPASLSQRAQMPHIVESVQGATAIEELDLAKRSQT